jgi:hypothetical protein
LREFDHGVLPRASLVDLRYLRSRMVPGPLLEDVQPAGEAAPSSKEAPSGSDVTQVAPARSPGPFHSVTHDVLFAPSSPRCDACEGEVSDDAATDEVDGGHGLYIWMRHGEPVYEEPPLCPRCATAITITALQRWEIEEEEG